MKKKSGQFVVGFAAETDDLMNKASEKLKVKALDLIVANDITQTEAGFDSDTNAAMVLDAHGIVEDIPLMSKRDVAMRILDLIHPRL